MNTRPLAGLPFMKMHGLGNDFMVIDLRAGGTAPAPQTIARLADRHRGVGFDQFAAMSHDDDADLRLRFWNADGSTSSACGNATRCIARFVMDQTGRDRLRLRTSSIDSIEADDNLMLAIATESRLMPHLHLSLQAGDDMILKRMKRRHLRDDAIRFCDEVRRLRPDMVFGADIIAGFPTETEAMFRNSLDLVAECGLTFLHVFPYSARKGTPAARMPAVPGPAIRERAARLREAGDRALRRHLDAQIGRHHRVLTEGSRIARTEQFTEVALSRDRPEGTLLDLRITGHDGRRLTA